MFERVYLGPEAQRQKPRIERMMRALFDHYVEHPPPPAVDADATTSSAWSTGWPG